MITDYKQAWQLPKDDWNHASPIWREVSESVYDALLGCMPPLHWNGKSFLILEAWDQRDGQAIHLAVMRNKDRYYVRYYGIKDFLHDQSVWQ